MTAFKGGWTYIITNQYHTVLYTGVTSDLRMRMQQHIEKAHPKSFSAKYKCHVLVWFQEYNCISLAIEREKQIKGGSRMDKIKLVNGLNPE